MTSGHQFNPDWISSPGETILDILHERHLSAVEFAYGLGCTPQQVQGLLRGRTSVTIGIARQLVQVLGASVEFWMSRDYHYRQEIVRLHAADEEWLAELPLGDMIRFGWLSPAPRKPDEAESCLRFFGVPNVLAWRRAYANLQGMVAFRTSPSFESDPASVAAWLRQGEIEGQRVECNPWDRERFRKSLEGIRSLTREKHPSVFIPKLRRICAISGVALAVVRAPHGCRASGATRFLSGTKALLLLTFRHLSDDQFWFTFFHEAGHLLLHGERGFFIEGVGAPATKEEQEANEFSGSTLVPTQFRESLLALPTDSREVIKFARRRGVSPGIVVGQLQHYQRIERYQLNGLKRRFRWEDDDISPGRA
jgi:HTH-type transcriptional regulator/antitoxin HigA